jgi:hypothetical protein
MAVSRTDAERFASLFAGYNLAYGTYAIRGSSQDGKAIGKAQTLRGEPTIEIYQQHLDGRGAGLGVIMLREDNTVFFGAIDYDNKTMDHAKAEARIRELDLPLVLCRSKSGGGHFYCFTSEPVPAYTMRDRLGEWASVLGMAVTTEQFPKQTSRYSEADIGNWINLPYFDAENTNRYAFALGSKLPLQGFLDLAESKRQTLEQMQTATVGETALFDEGPPCLQTIESQGGFVEGTKKDGMFNVGVYLKKAHSDDWAVRLDAYNTVMANLKSDEIQGLVRQLSKKEYSFKCKSPPINACCNRRVCRTRLHGVGQTDSEESRGYSIGALTRYESPNGDEPLFAMEVNGKRVLITTAQLYSRDEFNRACISQANVIPVHMTPARWLRTLNDLLPTADLVPLPEDASPLGQLWEYIEMFLTQQVMAVEKEKVILGQPFRDGDRTYFRSIDLFKYLDGRRIQYKSPQMVYDFLKRKGGEKTFWNVGGKGINVWYLPTPVTHAEPAPEPPPDDRKEAF